MFAPVVGFGCSAAVGAATWGPEPHVAPQELTPWQARVQPRLKCNPLSVKPEAYFSHLPYLPEKWGFLSPAMYRVCVCVCVIMCTDLHWKAYSALLYKRVSKWQKVTFFLATQELKLFF